MPARSRASAKAPPAEARKSTQTLPRSCVLDSRQIYGRCRRDLPSIPRRGHGVMSSFIEQPQRLALPALLAGGIAIAFSPIFVRLSELGPIATGFHRLFLALPLLWLWMHWDGRHAA